MASETNYDDAPPSASYAAGRGLLDRTRTTARQEPDELDIALDRQTIRLLEIAAGGRQS